MPATLDQTAIPWTLRLQGEMDINCAADFKTLLIQALASGKDMELDLRQATALDVTALQLLWAAEREARGVGQDSDTLRLSSRKTFRHDQRSGVR